jgi:hypothetical protein
MRASILSSAEKPYPFCTTLHGKLDKFVSWEIPSRAQPLRYYLLRVPESYPQRRGSSYDSDFSSNTPPNSAYLLFSLGAFKRR